MYQRERIIKRTSQYILRIQKSLEMINVKVHEVLSDIKGKSGLSILESITGGERRPDILADLVHHRVKATREEIIKSLEGNWNDSQLLIMRQNFDAYCFALKQVEVLDFSIEHSLTVYSQLAAKSNSAKPIVRVLKRQQPFENAFHFDLINIYDILDVNLIHIPEISSLTGINLISELGRNFTEKFPTVKQFCS